MSTKYTLDISDRIKGLLKRLDDISGELISIRGAISHLLKMMKKYKRNEQ